MTRSSLLVAVLACGLAAGYLAGSGQVFPGKQKPVSAADRATEIIINRPKSDGSGRTYEHLRVYRTHGDPVELRPAGAPMYIVTVRAPNGDRTWFAEPIDE